MVWSCTAVMSNCSQAGNSSLNEWNERPLVLYETNKLFLPSQAPLASVSTHWGAPPLLTWPKTLKDLHLVLKVGYQILFDSVCFLFFGWFFLLCSFSFMKTPTSHGITLEQHCSAQQHLQLLKTKGMKRGVMKTRLLIIWTFTLSP